ncbi:hypothetical protein Tco_1020388 [Tanacetum coccineum]|uniref:Uncharacterized protein n=1 Tax=Tanacetum coccineum TaxID=301880 RepID=A0ABQ5FZZ7_9ASTR
MFENAFNSEFKERMQKYTRFDAQSLQDAMICNMDSIGKYMLEITVHQQRTPQLWKQKKLMQTQDHSNPIQALNVNSLKVDLVVIQNTCSEKEDILSKKDLKGTRIEHGFKRAFMSLFGQDVDTFTSTILLNIDQLQKQLDKDEVQEDGSMAAFWVIDTGKAVDDDLVITENSGTKSEVQDDSSRSGNDTDADNADTRPIYNEEPMAEVQLTAECNIFAIGQQHTEQPEIINEGRVDQYPEQCQVKSHMLDSSPDNQTSDYSKQSLESENILLKKTVAQFQKDFSKMEAHCIALELKYQNQALKSGQHGQILNETINKATIKKKIDVLETINIELEHNVAKLHKENENLKKHYKDLYDFIKITRSKTIEQTTSLLANNADLKAQIQEKVFAIATLKNDLRKLKGNSVDTKFAKKSVLGKPVLQSLRNQLVVRQPNAFKSERPQMSKLRFASQVDVNKKLSRPVTQHYLPKRREPVSTKPDHMIASSESRDSSKNMPRFSSNNMVHNHYLDEARKKTQERDRNSKTSVMPSARFQSTADGSKPKPRSNNQTPRSLPVSKSSCVTITAVPKADHSKSSSSFSDSKQFICSTCHKCVFNANHDPPMTLAPQCLQKFLKQIDSHDVNDRVGKSIRSFVRRIFQWRKSSCFKSSAVTTADASDKRQQQPDSTSSSSALATTVTAEGNFDLSYALSWKPCQGDSLNLPDHRIRRRCCSLIPAKSDSLPHTHTQAFKVNHSASRLLIQNFLKDLQTQVDQESQIKMIQVKEMMQDKDLKNSKSKDKGSRSRSQKHEETKPLQTSKD